MQVASHKKRGHQSGYIEDKHIIRWFSEEEDERVTDLLTLSETFFWEPKHNPFVDFEREWARANND